MEIYHIVNRGIDSKPIFTNKKEHLRAKKTLDFYRYQSSLRFSHFLALNKDQKKEFLIKRKEKSKKIVAIVAYCLMPNHFHLLCQQITRNGISKFMSKFTNSYVRYFNTRYKRKGPLLEGMFKAVRISTESQLIHTSRYIHINPATSYLIKKGELANYHWSSLREYLKRDEFPICETKIIMNHFGNTKDYYRFLLDRIDYGRTLEKIKHLILED